jgi:hypothetical protein
MGSNAAMGITRNMMAKVLHGDHDERVVGITTLIMWFAVGAFFISTLNTYTEMLTHFDLPDQVVAFIGGTVAALLAAKFG